MENKKETKVIRVLSRQNFNNYIKENGWLESGVPKDCAVIEIFNSDIVEDSINRFAIEDEFNYVNNLKSAKLFGNNVLHLVFDDILGDKTINIDGEDKDLELFRFHQAKEVIKFIIGNLFAKKWVIHCSAGISRSGAIGKFLFDIFKSMNFDVEFPDVNNIHPNGYVLNMLTNTQKCIEYSDFGNDICIFPSITKTQLCPWLISNNNIKDNEVFYKDFIKKELNESDENVSKLINDIIADKFDLRYINSYIFEMIMNDKKDELV